MNRVFTAGAILSPIVLAVSVYASYRVDLAETRRELSTGSAVANTECGPVEYSDAGSGPAVLAIHGAGGGYDQMEEFSRALVAAGFRVVSVSRFGYLRTPSPADPGLASQAAAHACILADLGIDSAAVLAVSAGAPSAMRFCSRYVERCRALALVVPAAYAPGTTARETTPPSPYMKLVLDHVLASDFLIWIVTRAAPGVLIETVLATPVQVYRASDESERRRALSIIRKIFPVSLRREGLRNDAGVVEGMSREALENIRAPTLAISAEDDLYRTLAGARYAAERIPGARLVVYRTGGHALLGHHADVTREIVTLFRSAIPARRPDA
jgi:pimeloyl-ACP methyl ester carboxylesterase